jgi:hypothetical protein
MNIYLSYPQPPLNNICIISKLSYLYFLIPSLISFSARTSLQLLSVPATAPACRSHLPGIFISRCIAFISLTARLLWCSLGLLFLVAHGALPNFSSSLQSRGVSPPSQLDLHLRRELFPGAARRFTCSASSQPCSSSASSTAVLAPASTSVRACLSRCYGAQVRRCPLRPVVWR